MQSRSCSPTYRSPHPRTVAEIQEDVIEQRKNYLTSVYGMKSDGEVIAAWQLDMNWILHVLNVHSACLRLAVTDFPS